jgi:hypothetical protein
MALKAAKFTSRSFLEYVDCKFEEVNKRFRSTSSSSKRLKSCSRWSDFRYVPRWELTAVEQADKLSVSLRPADLTIDNVDCCFCFIEVLRNLWAV